MTGRPFCFSLSGHTLQCSRHTTALGCCHLLPCPHHLAQYLCKLLLSFLEYILLSLSEMSLSAASYHCVAGHNSLYLIENPTHCPANWRLHKQRIASADTFTVSYLCVIKVKDPYRRFTRPQESYLGARNLLLCVHDTRRAPSICVSVCRHDEETEAAAEAEIRIRRT